VKQMKNYALAFKIKNTTSLTNYEHGSTETKGN
jgi:hypothetical protein